MPGLELDGRAHLPVWPERRDVGIGVVGAGFIVRDCHLVAYAAAGFPVVGITSRSPETAEEVARLRGIPQVYSSLDERCSRTRRSRWSTSRSRPRSSRA